MRNATLIGSFGVLKEGDFEDILKMFADGTFQPVIDSVMPMSKAADAHRRIEAGDIFGKIILVPDMLY
jgi:NADPH:quinone reductase-like Zn-dependent oxidoreductase